MEELSLVKNDKEFQAHSSRIQRFIEQSRIWLIAIFLCAACTPVLSFWLYSSASRDEIRSGFLDNVETIAIAAATLIDADAHARMVRENTVSQDYDNILAGLGRLHSNLPQVTSLYTLIIEDNQTWYGVDTANTEFTGNSMPEPDAVALMQPRDAVKNDELAWQAIRNLDTYTFTTPVSDEQGSYVSACAPLAPTEGALPAAACVNVSTSLLDEHLAALQNRQIIASLITALLCLFICFSVVQHRNQIRFSFKLLKDQRDLYMKSSHTDPLTGALNRRSFALFYDTAEAQLNRNNLQFAVIAFDIDHFKTINDTYGHDTGDKVLIEIVNSIKGCLRINDCLARMGGEEFIVLCTVTSPDDVNLVAEKLRKTVEKIVVTTEENKPITFTISLGTYPVSKGDDRKEALKAADIALYHAKQNGRNQVVRYSASLEEKAADAHSFQI